jgi:hypothetical protein
LIVSISGARLLDFLTMGGLALQKESFWELAFSAKLKRPEVFVPSSLRNVGRVQTPLLQGKEVFHGDVAFSGAVEQVLAKAGLAGLAT